MAHSIIALANSKLLRWARESAGYDIATAARKLGQDEKRLLLWEADEEKPTIAQLRKVGEVYKRPIAVFYLPDVPMDFAPLRDYRRLPSEAPKEFSPELRLAIRHAIERQEWAIDLRKESGSSPLSFVGSVRDETDVLRVATQVRKLLAIDLVEQKRWQYEDALRHWIDAVEAIGVFVFQARGIDLLEMRGFVLTDTLAPIITLNAKDSKSARIFTLIHEFVHVLLAKPGISNLSLPETPRGVEQSIEVFCNAVAGETLVPAAALREELKSFRADDPDAAIESVSMAYKTSREVAARRLLDLGYISQRIYRERRAQYYEEYKEREKRSRESTKELRIPQARIIVRDNGRAFTRLVLSAFGENLITARDISALLNSKLRHLGRIKSDLYPLGLVGGVE